MGKRQIEKGGKTMPGGPERLGAIHPDKYKLVTFSSLPEKGSRTSI
jgi:hypothetical protein